MMNKKKLWQIRKPLCVFLAIVLYFLASYNFATLSYLLISGKRLDKTIEIIRPSHGYRRIPVRRNTIKFKGANKLAVDYAQVYFPSQEFSDLKKNYKNGYLAPMGGEGSRYAPFVHFINSISLCKLPYGYASFLHIFIQLTIFFIIYFYSFRKLQIKKIPLGMLLATTLLFSTPDGLSWVERGQFSLFVASGYLLLFLGLFKRNLTYIVLSALFSYFKWTSLPYIFVIFVLFFLSEKDSNRKRQIFFYCGVFSLIFLILFISFFDEGIYFLEGIIHQELKIPSHGISILNILPRFIAKASPVLLIAIGWLYIKKDQKDARELIPYFIGSAIFLLMYPTLASHYNTPSLISLIPLIFYWAEQKKNMPSHLSRKIAEYSFFLSLFLMSYSKYIVELTALKPSSVTYFYLVPAMIFLFLPMLLDALKFSSQLVDKHVIKKI